MKFCQVILQHRKNPHRAKESKQNLLRQSAIYDIGVYFVCICTLIILLHVCAYHVVTKVSVVPQQ